METEESFVFSVVDAEEIRDNDNYEGFRVKLEAKFEQINQIVTVDITTGDIITPKETIYLYDSIIGTEKYEMLAYPVETILAEKIETVLSRSITSTRPRDYYDIYILFKLKREIINIETLKEALEKTMKYRETIYLLDDYDDILNLIVNSEEQSNNWEKYCKEHNYASDLIFKEVIEFIREVLIHVVSSIM